MKRFCFLVILIFLLSNCTKNPSKSDTKDNFSIRFLKDTSITIDQLHNLNLSEVKLDSSPWLSSEDIEFYDFSTHYIYLKTSIKDFFPDFEDRNSDIDFKDWHFKPFVVCAYGKPCYVGCLHVSFCVRLKYDVSISDDTLYDYEDIIKINNLTPDLYSIKQTVLDVRNDSDVMRALKEDGIYHAGLDVQLNNVKILENSDTAIVEYTFTVTNNDEDNLYIMDPDLIDEYLLFPLMGLLIINESDIAVTPIGFKPYIDREYLENWNPSWFTKINSGQLITRIITKEYENIPTGHYYCRTRLSSRFYIQKSDRKLPDGRYWLGYPTKIDFFEIDVD